MTFPKCWLLASPETAFVRARAFLSPRRSKIRDSSRTGRSQSAYRACQRLKEVSWSPPPLTLSRLARPGRSSRSFSICAWFSLSYPTVIYLCWSTISSRASLTIRRARTTFYFLTWPIGNAPLWYFSVSSFGLPSVNGRSLSYILKLASSNRF